jgi:hypothetical protein
MIKHYKYKFHSRQEEMAGRFAVSMADGIFRLERISGNPPPSEILKALLAREEFRPFVEWAEKENEKRRLPYNICERRRVSGSLTVLLRELQSIEMKIIRTRRIIYVSSMGKLIHGIKANITDLVVCLKLSQFKSYWVVSDEDSLELEEAQLADPDELIWTWTFEVGPPLKEGNKFIFTPQDGGEIKLTITPLEDKEEAK